RVRLAFGFDRLDEPHRPAAAVTAVERALLLEAERGDPFREPDVHDECDVAVADGTAGNAAQRPHEVGDVVTEPLGAGPVLDATRLSRLRDGAAVSVEQALQDAETHPSAVSEVTVRNEGRVPIGACEAEVTQR